MHISFEDIVSLENLFLAWQEFRRGKRKRKDVAEFEFNLEDNLFYLHESLYSKNYTHSPYTGFYVSDPKLRHIHKASVRDRLLHQAIFRKLYAVFDLGFIYDSYSCRFQKGTHAAVRRLAYFSRKISANNRNTVWALKCDIRKFFDSIDQRTLLDLLKKKISDPGIFWLLRTVLGSFEKTRGKGLPLGNVTSQLFANIYLNELDQFVKKDLKRKYYLRYCDDFIILGETREELSDLLQSIEEFLKNHLSLNMHQDKISIRKYSQGIDFVGYIVKPHLILLRTKTKRRIVKKLRAVNTYSKNSIESYLGILSYCNSFKIRKKLQIDTPPATSPGL